MQLRRIEIRDFRKLGHAVIDDIGDGLSVIVGDNEAGKSTVLAALRAVLFERHRITGEPVKRMLPYGQAVRPEVEIEFDLRGQRCRLRKAFNQRPEAELVVGTERLSGDAAEERLAELFNFTPPGRGESKREDHQGIFGLLWVEQGQSHRSLGVGDGGKATLASAIEGEVGQIVGGERGRALLAAATERKEAFWGRNDKPRGDYRALADRLLTLRDHAETIELRLRQFDGKVEALAARNEALARHRRDERLVRAAATVASCRRAVERAVSFESARDEAFRRRDGWAKDRIIAAERRHRRSEMIGFVESTQRDVERAELKAAEARVLLASQRALAESGETRAAASRRARLDAEQQLRWIDQAADWRRRSAAFRTLAAQLAQAETHVARRRHVLASVACIAIAPKDIAELERLQKLADSGRSALAAASVRLDFAPDGERSIRVDGKFIAADAPLSLARDAAIWLEGFGLLSIKPGGGIDDLAGSADAAGRALDAGLCRFGVAGVTEARALLARKTDAEAEAAGLAKLVSALAPSGIDALRQVVENERAALAIALPAGAAGLIDAPDGTMEEARRGHEDAMAAEEAATAAAQITRAAREQAARDLAVFEERAASARTGHDRCVADLSVARAKDDDDHLRERLADADQALARAEADAARAEADLLGLDAETARLDLQRAEGMERTIRADIAQLTADKREFEVELGVLGQGGLGEELSEIEGQIERLQREKRTQDLEAAASRLLLDTLAAAQRESKERWLGPVRDRVRPYLKFLEPGSDIVLNEQTLEIEGLLRNGVNEPFHALSMGAREQMAVITRLALADILRDSGQPSVLILDDALVNTDEGRLERMHRVLQTAAASLQVLVLTCRERDFIGLGHLKRL